MPGLTVAVWGLEKRLTIVAMMFPPKAAGSEAEFALPGLWRAWCSQR